MIGGLVTPERVSFILVFMEGTFSFFSPCIIPLIPVYMGFLAGGGKMKEEDGTIIYDRRKVFFHTVFFVLGISFAFALLGMSFTVLGKFLNSNRTLFARLGGILIILLGLFQLGLLDVSFLQKERKINLNLKDKEMNSLIALMLGFTFSFAWTPCIGPILSSVLIMASGADTAAAGYMLVLLYTMGFILPFLLLGLFTAQVLEFLKDKKKFLQYAIKAGGVILVIMGIMTFTGWMNGFSGYLNSLASGRENSVTETAAEKTTGNIPDNTGARGEKRPVIPAFDFTLTDQYGKEHTLSDYKGQVVFLNFWASWCPPCKEEMPYIEELYKEYNNNKDEVVFLGIANPKSEKHPGNQDEKKEELLDFLDNNGLTFPILFDETGEILNNYYISAFPTTFMIDKKGNVFGYVPGMMTKDIMKNIIDQTLQSTE